MTFSLLARCPHTGAFGMVICSSSPAVAARCAHARAGVGVVASQNITDPALGPQLLDLLEAGQSAGMAMAGIMERTPQIAYRQLLAVDAMGGTAIHSGSHTLGVWGVAQGPGVIAAGNLLASPDVPGAMVAAFEASTAALGERLMAALLAGRDAGGEAGPVHSAGLLMVDRLSWPVADLRCDWAEDARPIETLARIWEIYSPQMEAYVQRAENPGAAPAYGVPGDE
ncbi:MAG: DUF1028 domain-containing protein [Tabrizicola sp.]|nr:DUF1028 domain-containing protein [Tabrizicola sp.]